MTPLREAFEAFAKDYWEFAVEIDYVEQYDAYTESDVQAAWRAWQESYKATLLSLAVGIDTAPQGTQVALMSKVGETTTVLATTYTEMNKDGFMKVTL